MGQLKLKKVYPHYRFNILKSLADFVIHVPEFFPEELCDRIIEEYVDSTYIFGEHPTPTDIRNVDQLEISSPEVINEKNSYARKKLDADVFECFSRVPDLYPETLCVTQDIGYSLRRMKQGQFYKEHVDQGNTPVAITASVVLNTDFTGGDFCLFGEELCFSLNKGSLLTFPSNFLYPHSVSEVTSGTRYALVTWMHK